MKKTVVLVIMICLISVGISEAVVSEENNIELESNSDSYTYMKSIVNRVAKLNENDFKPVKNDNEYYGNPQPCLGGDEVFGLWINIVYKGKSHLEKISIDPRMIKGKITDPYYRTPIKFNVDDDPDYDIETGFGFFQYGIDEIREDGSYINHPCWTTAFDFQQIFNQLDDQTAELEIWQEFHINLSLLKTSRSDKSTTNKNSMLMGKSRLSSFFTQLFERISQKIERFPLLKILLDELFMRFHNDPTIDDIEDNPAPMNAGEDYYVIRVGVRSPEGEKIPLSFEKKFACAKEGVFRPFIFQKETDPSDIIGEDNIDVMYGFQGFQSGHSTPSYNIEFTINFNPSVYSMIQFIPREGKITYYYHQVGAADALDITFSSKVSKGGDETEGTLSLTLTLDTPQAAAGSGKWMSFEPEILGDWEPLGGKLIYFASHKFNVGVTVGSPRFEQKAEFKGIPKSATLKWDADLEISSGEMFYLHGAGNLDLSMSSKLDQITVYYPQTNKEDSLLPCLEINSIPSTSIGASGTLNVDVDNLLNPANYVNGRAYRSSGDDIPSIKLFLPDEEIEEPIVKITEIPSNVDIRGNLEWAKLKGEVYASRGSAQNKDPVWINVEFGNYTIYNKLTIHDGIMDLRFKIAEDGYFFFDSSKRMFGNELEITDTANDNALSLTVDEFSADNVQADWALDTSGGQIQIEDLALSGFLDTLKNFHISLTYEGKNVQFDADWKMGQQGNIEFDFLQEDNLYLDFDLSQGDVILYGDIELQKDLHWDVSWKWEQGSSATDPAYFRINHLSNEPNIKELNFFFTYQDEWGADVTLQNGGIYICSEWYWHNGWLYIWPVIDIVGTLDFWVKLSWLTDYNWREVV